MEIVSFRLDATGYEKLVSLAHKVANGNTSEVLRRLVARAEIGDVTRRDVMLPSEAGREGADV